jgi:hypothetical protein
MFGLFNKSPKGPKVIDKVWLSNKAKWNACLQMVKADPSVLLVAWFEETFSELQSNGGVDGNIIKADQLSYDKTVGKLVVFVEHYPLSSVEQTLFTNAQLSEVPVLSSLEDPIFMTFGGERTIEIMKRLGVGDEEIIGHAMVTKSIRRAQEKIAGKTGTDYPAKSSKEWFTLNFKS